MATLTHKVHKVIAEVGTSGRNCKRLTLTSWNDNAPKIDIRTWVKDGKKITPGKGITFSVDEAKILAKALSAYIAQCEEERNATIHEN